MPLLNPQQDFKVSFETYQPSQSSWITSDCNEILFWNKGTSNIFLNDVVLLQPDDFLSINGNKDEIDRTQYRYQFQGAGDNVLAVIKKTYV